MKIQIIKIIPCLLVGLILSACVGAVNLAEGAVKNTKSNTETEEEPIVVDPEVALINRCTTKDLATDASCAPIVADHPCIEDPFGGACDITFTDYYKTAQANRISFCRENPTNNLCTGAIENVCTDNPLDADLCFNDNTYHKTHEQMCEADPTAPRCQTTVSRICKGNVFHGFCDDTPLYESARIDDCITAGNAMETRCKTAFTAEHCALNPFSVNCDNENYILTARDNRVNFCKSASGSDGVCASFTACEANPYGAGCGTHFEYKKVPTAASWLQSLDSPLPIRPEPAHGNPKNEFLQGTETGLNSEGATNPDWGLRINSKIVPPNPDVQTLTLASNTLGQPYNNSLGGNNADGVAFFRGAVGDNIYYYAGILSGTDLGAPRTETSGTAQWNGIFHVLGNTIVHAFDGRNIYIDTSVHENFILTINFGAGEQAGTIEAGVRATNGYDILYSLTGNFDGNGVITGNVERSVSNLIGDTDIYRKSGILTGLIGQEGAVGAFISETSMSNGGYYSGGFVARPPDDE